MQDIFYYSKGSLTVTSKILDWLLTLQLRSLPLFEKTEIG